MKKSRLFKLEQLTRFGRLSILIKRHINLVNFCNVLPSKNLGLLEDIRGLEKFSY